MQPPKIDAKDRLIVALDTKDVAAARGLVRQLEDVVSFFKIGLVLQLAPGNEEFIHELLERGTKVFLDYKYFDIEETVRKAVARASQLGVSFLTIHTAGNVFRGAISGRANSDLKLFAVTVLTDMDKADISDLGHAEQSVEELVLYRARKALEAGCDGVIASGLEAAAIKKMSDNRLLVITPGIRPEGYPDDDQKRKVTPRLAIEAGADYLVVGRPIAGQSDPAKHAGEMLAEMQQAFDSIAPPAVSAAR
jgi:orotidine-5'-phosphate decarboxylase